MATSGPMRRIIAGMRQASEPGRVHEAYEGTLYGQGDPLDMDIAAEQQRIQQERGARQSMIDSLTFVDPRLQRDDPAAAAKLSISGNEAASRIPQIQDGPLTTLLNQGRMTARTLPMVRGAQRTEDIADANAVADNYSSTPQIAYRNAQRHDTRLGAQTAAETFMDPVVAGARQQGQKEQTAAALAEGRDPLTQGYAALRQFLAGVGGNAFASQMGQMPQMGDLMRMFQLPNAGAAPVTPPASAAAPSGGAVMTSQQVLDAAVRANKDPKSLADELRKEGVTITP